MTNDEAIKIRSAFSNGFHYPFGGGFEENCDMDEVNRHAELLNEAIEKQIPKEPFFSEYITIPCYQCPACNGVILGKKTASYCCHCGQALDWDDVI